MLLSQTILQMLNNQISHEHNNETIYRNVQAYFSNLNLEGFYAYFGQQAEGEYGHRKHIIEYLDQKNAKYAINTLQYDNVGFTDIKAILDLYYNTEILTTQKLYAITKQAKVEGDEGTISWLYDVPVGDTGLSLINEQIEEESSALLLRQEVLDGLGDNEQLNNQWIRQVNLKLLQRLE